MGHSILLFLITKILITGVLCPSSENRMLIPDPALDLVAIPSPIILKDGRHIGVTFLFVSSDGKSGNQPVRARTLAVLKHALRDNPAN
jgi:hypothetical protein